MGSNFNAKQNSDDKRSSRHTILEVRSQISKYRMSWSMRTFKQCWLTLTLVLTIPGKYPLEWIRRLTLRIMQSLVVELRLTWLMGIYSTYLWAWSTIEKQRLLPREICPSSLSARSNSQTLYISYLLICVDCLLILLGVVQKSFFLPKAQVILVDCDCF